MSRANAPPIQRGSTRAELRAVIAERNAKLCERIRVGDADTGSFAERVNEIALIACAEAPGQPPARCIVSAEARLLGRASCLPGFQPDR